MLRGDLCVSNNNNNNNNTTNKNHNNRAAWYDVQNIGHMVPAFYTLLSEAGVLSGAAALTLRAR